jgi:N-acetylglucosaminyldiphosphoundecaprenol N-acetyl-beta-D-mannosaminyltransferase
MKTILLAKEDESVKEALESLDVTVIAETGILDAVGEATFLRRSEIERREFFLQLMKIFERNGHTVYVLGEEAKEVEDACQYIINKFPRMKIVGSNALAKLGGIEDKAINEINMIAPDVIISVMPSPMQEKFLKEYKSMFLAKIWYGMGAEHISEMAKLTFSARFKKLLRKFTLKRYVKEESNNKESE